MEFGIRTTRVRAFAKINLSLRVFAVRPDGYHELRTVFQSIALHDTLHVRAARGAFAITCNDPACPIDSSNFVSRAAHAVWKAAGRRGSPRDVVVRLQKRIPVAAGLGGGSSDAAAALRAFTRLWKLDRSRLPALAASLGADVPFCLVGGRARVKGIGEIVEPLPFEVREFTLLTPPLSVDTSAVYRRWDELGGPTADGPNDLEPAALAVEPGLAEWRDRLGDATGQTPQLAGSGSTWFVEGAFPDVVGAVVTRTDRP